MCGKCVFSDCVYLISIWSVFLCVCVLMYFHLKDGSLQVINVSLLLKTNHDDTFTSKEHLLVPLAAFGISWYHFCSRSTESFLLRIIGHTLNPALGIIGALFSWHVLGARICFQVKDGSLKVATIHLWPPHTNATSDEHMLPFLDVAFCSHFTKPFFLCVFRHCWNILRSIFLTRFWCSNLLSAERRFSQGVHHPSLAEHRRRPHVHFRRTHVASIDASNALRQKHRATQHSQFDLL